MFNKSSVNYAETVAKPIEDALIANGAVKLCDGGNAGRGSDNRSPYYDAYYSLSSTRQQTESLVQKIAKENSFQLNHASQTNKGQLSGVADMYIDHWYFDNTSKESSYTELESGKIELAFALYNDRESSPVTACEKKESPITVDADNTFIRIKVQLPNMK